MRGGRGTKVISRKRAGMSLDLLLCGCTDERLASFTAEGLAASYRVTRETAERKLSEAKMRRGLV